MSIYQDAQDMVLDAMKEFGAQGWIIRKTQGEYDPITGQFVDGVDEKYQAYGIQAEFGLQESGMTNIHQTLIQKGDKKITLAAKGLLVTPELTDKIELCGKVYQVLNVKEINPAGIVIKYDVQGRL